MLLPVLRRYVPASFERYFEPFFGGGALYFALQPRHAILSDSNADLIECYRMVRDDTEAVIRRLSRYENSPRCYRAVRNSRPRSPTGRAARFLYLTRLAFNGLYRVNTRGEFNVPYGWKTHLDVVQADAIRQTARALDGRTLVAADFAEVLATAEPGDFVYLDPPYTVAHQNNGFLKYNAKVFSWQDQARLAATAATLADRGCKVLVTNACHPSIRKLFKGLKQTVVRRLSRIAASPDYRRPVNELVITNI